MTVLTADAVAGYAYAAGLRGNSLDVAVAIAHAESGLNTTSHNGNAKTGDDSYGLWQINLYGSLGPPRRKQFGLVHDSDLFDPTINAKAMYAISSGGTNWKPWSTYNSGAYRQYLSEAQSAGNATTARNGAGSTSSPPLETQGVLAGEVPPPHVNLDLRATTVPPTFPVLESAQVSEGTVELLARAGITGQVDMSVDSITQVTATYADAIGDLNPWAALLIGTNFSLFDLDLVVAGQDWGDNSDVPSITATMRPTVIDNLRSNDPHKSTSQMWSNMSATEVVADRALAAGARFYGKATARRDTITRAGIDDTTSANKLAETDWDMIQRLAKEEGFWAFETSGAIYFAPPSWLWGKTTAFSVRYDGNTQERLLGFETIGVPQCSAQLDSYPYGIRAVARTVTFKMVRWRGELVRPGMSVNFQGIPGFDKKRDNTGPAQWLVTKVTWPLDGGVAPVTVTLTEAMDPIPQPAADETFTDASTAAGPASTAVAPPKGGGSFPTGTGVSNHGTGSYGYQYDKVGKAPATGPQPGAVVLMNHLLVKYPQATNNGIFDSRLVDGTSSLSVHAEGRAGDTGVPRSSAMGDALASYLVGNANLMGIQCVIWNARIWFSTSRKWGKYTPANGKNDDSTMHRNHVHWELCWEAARYLNDAALRGAIAHGSTTDGGFW